jgi:hypothetical protein
MIGLLSGRHTFSLSPLKTKQSSDPEATTFFPLGCERHVPFPFSGVTTMLEAAEYLALEGQCVGDLGPIVVRTPSSHLPRTPENYLPRFRVTWVHTHVELFPFALTRGGGTKSTQGGRTSISGTITDFFALSIKFS